MKNVYCFVVQDFPRLIVPPFPEKPLKLSSALKRLSHVKTCSYRRQIASGHPSRRLGYQVSIVQSQFFLIPGPRVLPRATSTGQRTILRTAILPLAANGGSPSVSNWPPFDLPRCRSRRED